MKDNSNLKNLIIVGAILVAVALAGYFYFTRDTSSDELLSSTDSSAASAVDSDLLSALRELRKLHLDDSIFSDPVWLSLHDFSKTLAPQQPFRPNPFAPFDASSFSSASTTVSR